MSEQSSCRLCMGLWFAGCQHLNAAKITIAGHLVTYMEFQGNLCCYLVSDSILGYSILTPCYLSHLNSWIWKLQGIKWRKTGREDRRPIYLLYFAFISRFNNHSVDEEILPEYEWNGVVEADNISAIMRPTYSISLLFNLKYTYWNLLVKSAIL